MKCNTCNTEFVPFSSLDDQADGCAATLYLKEGSYYILGHYGSRMYDMQKYILNKNTGYQPGNICDDCISKLINNGSAHLIEDGVW
jgi:hypothetical protein